MLSVRKEGVCSALSLLLDLDLVVAVRCTMYVLVYCTCYTPSLLVSFWFRPHPHPIMRAEFVIDIIYASLSSLSARGPEVS